MRRQFKHGSTAVFRDVLRGVDAEWAVGVHGHHHGSDVGLERGRGRGRGGRREGAGEGWEGRFWRSGYSNHEVRTSSVSHVQAPGPMPPATSSSMREL